MSGIRGKRMRAGRPRDRLRAAARLPSSVPAPESTPPMKRPLLLLPLVALALSASAEDAATNAVGVSFAPAQASGAFTIKDAIDCVVRYETPYGVRGSFDVLFYSIARKQDEDGSFWTVRYSARRNGAWPDVELRIRPTGEIEAAACDNKLYGHLFVPHLLHYCESAGIDLETVTGFLPARDEWLDGSSDEPPPEPPEPPDVIYTDEEHVDQFPDEAHGIVCWTNGSVRVTDSLLFETETNRFATLIAAADRIVVRKGGYICHSKNVDEQPVAATITNAAEIAAFNGSLRFYRNYPGLSCWCCGYPGIDWWSGGRRIVLSSVQHGRALRWEGFSGDMPLVKDSSIKLQSWLQDHGIESSGGKLAAPSPAEETHAEGAENAATEPHAESAEGAPAAQPLTPNP